MRLPVWHSRSASRSFVVGWLFVSIVFAAWSTRNAIAVEFDAAKLNTLRSRLLPFVEKQEISGAVAVIGTQDGIAKIEAIGQRNIEAKLPMTDNTLFKIASMTKPITALAVMMLVDEGKLSVDDPVEKILPEFKGQMLVASRAEGTITLKKPSRPISVRDLLTHTSGLPSGFPPGLADLYKTRQRTLAEAVLVSSQLPLDFEPGSKWSYCNAGIDTLGRIVEVLSGLSFESFLTQRLFQPLGMNDTTFYPSTEQLARAAQIYEPKNGQLVATNNLVVGPPVGAKHPVPAGGLYSTGPDLAKLYQAFLRRATWNGKPLVSEKSFAAMTQTQTGDLQCGFVPGMSFGYGFAVVKQPQGVTEMLSPGTFGHGGAFGTQGWIDPHQGVFVVLLIQRVGLKNGDGTDMRRELQAVAFGALKK